MKEKLSAKRVLDRFANMDLLLNLFPHVAALPFYQKFLVIYIKLTVA